MSGGAGKSNRFDYVKFDENTAAIGATFKDGFTKIADSIDLLGPGRAVSLALTKLEEAYMWVGKALRDRQIDRNGRAELQEERTDA